MTGGSMEGRDATALIGDSPPMRALRTTIARVARSRIAVLIQGPTGSGKELVARALHEASGRTGRFVAFNVCAVTETIFEDTLFGHVRGAYTGAAMNKKGYLCEANGGTLFLDEVSGLGLGPQAKLLRALETKEYRPLGAEMGLGYEPGHVGAIAARSGHGCEVRRFEVQS
jgi:DNA-binding NtrC family response regulator